MEALLNLYPEPYNPHRLVVVTLRLTLPWALLLALASAAGSAPSSFLCAASKAAPPAKATAALQLSPPHRATALVLFAHFAGEIEPDTPPPGWAADLFDPQRSGSIAHFYDEMSQGRHLLRGEVAARRYAGGPAASYRAADAVTTGQFGRFSLEILRQADRDIDFGRFDDDGPDGVPNSGDDDGVVDALFLVLPTVPSHFLLGHASGISRLGFETAFITDDPAAGSGSIRIEPDRGTLQRGHTEAAAVGAICHEYGHLLGLPDLFNTAFLQRSDNPGPEEDSAGIGRWGLMGWGALGWQEDDGPAPFSAWSRLTLGWAQVEELVVAEAELALEEVGKKGAMYRIPMGLNEYYLLAYRTRNGSFYDRNIPAAGLLVWHIGQGLTRRVVDLECADGRWADAGFPVGVQAAPRNGGDNLDFWAHDPAYAQVYNGNQGDATDPFGGLGADRFTPQTNPSSLSNDQSRGLYLEAIRLDGTLARATVRVEPPQLEIIEINVVDDSGDDFLAPGEGGLVRFRLLNRGGVEARDIEVQLTTVEPDLEIIQAKSHYERLKMAYQSGVPGDGFPRLRAGDFTTGGSRRATLTVRAPGLEPVVREFTLAAAVRVPFEGRLLDPLGQPAVGIQVLAIRKGSTLVMSTDEDGRFAGQLSSGSYVFRFNPPPASGLATGFNIIQVGEVNRVEISLVATTLLSGTVRDQEGRLLGGVGVEGPFFSQSSTDADGRFALAIPTVAAAIRIVPTLAQQQSGLAPVRLPLDPLASGPLDIVLPRGILQEVELVDLQGRPLRSKQLRFTGPRAANERMTNNDGQASLVLLPDIYSFNLLQIFNVGLWSTFNFRLFGLDLLPDTASLKLADLLQIFSGGLVTSFDVRALEVDPQVPLRLVVPELFAVEGRVVDISPEPFFQGRLRFTRADGFYASQIDLSAEGAYRTVLPQGQYLVTYEAQQSGASPSQRLDTVAVAGVASLDFTVDAPPSVQGRITDPVPEGLVLRAVSERVGLTATAQVAADGTFALSLRPDSYLFLAALPEGRGFWNLGMATVPAVSELTLAMPGGARLFGRVVQEGLPVVTGSIPVLLMLTDHPLDLFARVVPSDRRPSVLSTAPSAGALSDDGRYTITARPGSYALVALPNSGDGIGRAITGLQLEGASSRDIVLPDQPLTQRLYGTLSALPRALQGEWTLRLYDPETGVVVQQSDLFLGSSGSGYLRGRDYNIAVPPGTYRARIGLADPVLGFYQQHDLGTVMVAGDRRWDIELTPANTAVVDRAQGQPAEFALGQNYPNPFNGGTAIPFVLPRPGAAELTVFNLLGQRVARLAIDPLGAGPQTLYWDGRGRDGRPLATGLYIYRLQSGEWAQTRKLLLLR
ncbi:MAG: T9SS type A sorting domain-containing protein [Candidatus Latescibacteria bacterium]|nr:T9SS type A sorting domain-containing protein [Candidatus Latescibacterota bacterium]